MSKPPLEFRFRVRYAECDAQQVVFNARYADYVDIAVNELIRELFGHYQNMLDAGMDMQVVSMTLNWSAPARYDEVLCARIQVLRMGNTSFTLGVNFVRYPDELPIATAEVTYVMIDPATASKKVIPDNIRDRMATAGQGKVISHAGE